MSKKTTFNTNFDGMIDEASITNFYLSIGDDSKQIKNAKSTLKKQIIANDHKKELEGILNDEGITKYYNGKNHVELKKKMLNKYGFNTKGIHGLDQTKINTMEDINNIINIDPEYLKSIPLNLFKRDNLTNIKSLIKNSYVEEAIRNREKPGIVDKTVENMMHALNMLEEK